MRDVIDLCWYVPWLREGCQDRLAGSVPILFYLLLNMFRATMCPSSGADEYVILYSCVGMCRGWRKVVKTSWQLVLPLLFY
jgi:hypothetical protein